MRAKTYIGAALVLALVLFIFRAKPALGQEPSVAIKKSDRCPVCGMFVYKYPKWVALAVFGDGEYFFYDGAKDLFKHYFNVQKFSPGKNPEGIREIFVTDYYEVKLIEAKSAYYVIDSNVLGPMGHELLPFKDRESAQEFLEDHKGRSILRFDEVTPEVIASLDRRTEKPVPSVTLTDFNGKNVQLSELIGGRVALLHFWDIKCPHCNTDALVSIDGLYQRYRDKGFVTVAIQETRPEKGDAGIRKYDGVTYPMLIDASGKTARRFGVIAMPTTLLVDEKGVVRKTIEGDSGIDALEKLLTKLLK